MLVCALGLLAACAPKTGWHRTDVRSCGRDTPALVCVVAEPYRPLQLEIGGVTVLHGECVRPRSPDAHGSLQVRVTEDASGEQVYRIRLRKSSINIIEVGPDGTLAVRSTHPCDGTVPPADDSASNK